MSDINYVSLFKEEKKKYLNYDIIDLVKLMDFISKKEKEIKSSFELKFEQIFKKSKGLYYNLTQDPRNKNCYDELWAEFLIFAPLSNELFSSYLKEYNIEDIKSINIDGYPFK